MTKTTAASPKKRGPKPKSTPSLAEVATHRKAAADYQRSRYHQDIEKACAEARSKSRRKRERQPALYAAITRRSDLMRTYGVSDEDLDRVWFMQGLRCAITDEMRPTTRRLATDHDHALVGEACIRGIILARCNSALSFFDDDPEAMRRVADAVDAARAAGFDPQGLTSSHRRGLKALGGNTTHLRACAAYLDRHAARLATGITLIDEARAFCKAVEALLEQPPCWEPDPLLVGIGLAVEAPEVPSHPISLASGTDQEPHP